MLIVGFREQADGLLSFHKGWSSVHYAKGDEGSSEAPFLSI